MSISSPFSFSLLPCLFLLHPSYLYVFLSFEDLQTETFCLFYKVAIFFFYKVRFQKHEIFFVPQAIHHIPGNIPAVNLLNFLRLLSTGEAVHSLRTLVTMGIFGPAHISVTSFLLLPPSQPCSGSHFHHTCYPSL